MKKYLITTTLIAGSLDLIGASSSAYLGKGTTPDKLLKYIASGFFGKAALSGGVSMIVWGLLFHFLIVFACVIIFLLAYQRLRILHHKLFLNALLIATVAWITTNLIIVPLSHIGLNSFSTLGI